MAHIIIADDDELVGEIACDALVAAGHSAGLLSNGRDALRVIRTRKPDLAILDCNMPEMNGLLVLRALRNSVEFFDLPVLILTGRVSDKDVEIAYHEGATDYMKKPFDPDELAFRVGELLAKSPRTQPKVRPAKRKGFGRLEAR
ncbi:response regulator [Sphingomonas sp. RB3P16]|uniref:response regulator n=1 Tax=Parasphingomonas frigoris TaxID=3096163 RepID=UPI002FCC76A2